MELDKVDKGWNDPHALLYNSYAGDQAWNWIDEKIEEEL
jgi:hypothetical protein